MNIVKACPCCGANIDEDASLSWTPGNRLLVGRGHVAQIPRVQAKVFDALWKARSRFVGISQDEMRSIIYSDDPSGGPASRTVVSVHVMNLRKTLQPFGLTVRPYTGYMLVDLPKKKIQAKFTVQGQSASA